ncbi:lysylphosphatidylglycerol synthase transmembrane domain-containing protein [Fulvivirga ligni]|uniref:lysylphosphatidylglycerol synthase transmembrane domain-containing protein n=1 Tax=Fulvivirga ligni TaxID=2904246 RepID=UPI001F4504A9|nr:lysylphosphatidylglycerol synthase transmembrane domain-containing protein [Fulvivirga ligni]UII22788.1 flippase-like domain-containing protein [Fulvivirga ligni]
MSSSIKNGLKYVVMLGITAFLLWISFENIEVSGDETKWGFLMKTWNSADKLFLVLSAVAAVMSHVIRAERWKLLLKPLGYTPSLGHSFMSVMVGYFINLAVPRGGEVSRCYNLYRIDKTPVDVSFGTVVMERIIDVIFLVILLSTSFFIELDNLVYFFQSDEIKKLTATGDSSFSYTIIIGAVLFIVAIVMIVLYLFKSRRYLTLRYMSKARKIFKGLKSGLTSIFRLEKRFLFIVYSLGIWVCYYLMMYLVMLAFPETSHLGVLAALTIFVIGGIAMALPLPGGAGSFHILVPLGLVLLYNLPEEKAIPFTFIFHGWQTLVIIVVGAVSLFLSQVARKKVENTGKNI